MHCATCCVLVCREHADRGVQGDACVRVRPGRASCKAFATAKVPPVPERDLRRHGRLGTPGDLHQRQQGTLRKGVLLRRPAGAHHWQRRYTSGPSTTPLPPPPDLTTLRVPSPLVRAMLTFTSILFFSLFSHAHGWLVCRVQLMSFRIRVLFGFHWHSALQESTKK